MFESTRHDQQYDCAGPVPSAGAHAGASASARAHDVPNNDMIDSMVRAARQTETGDQRTTATSSSTCTSTRAERAEPEPGTLSGISPTPAHRPELVHDMQTSTRTLRPRQTSILRDANDDLAEDQEETTSQQRNDVPQSRHTMSSQSCCRCGPNGVCVGCSCAKAKRVCTNCQPGRGGIGNGNCRNRRPVPDNIPRHIIVGPSQKSTSACMHTQRDSSAQDGDAALLAMSASIGTQSDSFAQDRDAALLATIADSPSQHPPSASGARAFSDQVRTHEPRSDSQSHTSTGHRSENSAVQCDPVCWNADIETLKARFRSMYDEVVHWRRNVFLLPYGAAGNKFVDELARLIQAFASGSALRPIAWMAVAVASQLLLQRPHHNSKASENADHLQRRLTLWKDGGFEELLAEARTLQNHLPRWPQNQSPENSNSVSDVVFSNLVYHGKISAASSYICQESSRGVLKPPDMDEATGQSVRQSLLDKHPPATPCHPEALVQGEARAWNPIIFEALNANRILAVARGLNGSSGPSGLDAEAWRRMLTVFSKSSNRLCQALAAAARCLCTEDLDSGDLMAFTASRLIALNKSPGVRPIAVGEAFRRLIGKAVMTVVERDAMHVTAPIQLCVGVPSACEASVHAMAELYERTETQAILLVDAQNAFNSFNRQAALQNIPILCPAVGRMFRNTYSSPVRLFLQGGDEIASNEGTCQGDPLAMLYYALGTVPLIRSLQDSCPDTVQSWYADDDAVAGRLADLHHYWSQVTTKGRLYGYHTNASKSTLLVKPEYREEAEELFSDTNITVTTEGVSYLGGYIGSTQYCMEQLQKKIRLWTTQLDQCIQVAETQPHATYATLVTAIQNKWLYLQRAMPASADEYEVLEKAVCERLLPKLTGHETAMGSEVRRLLALPTRFGGLNIRNLLASAATEYQASRRITAPFVGLILNDAATPPPQPGDQLSEALLKSRTERKEWMKQKIDISKAVVEEICPSLSSTQKLLTKLAAEKGASSWLTEQPSHERGTVLNKNDFRDAVAIRYGFALDGLPASCVCGAPLTFDHAMTCPAGGYPTARHNHVRDVLADVVGEVVQEVEKEPVLLPWEGERLNGRTVNRAREARLDIRANGFWTRQQDAFFDIRVTHPKASLLSRAEIMSQLRRHESEKKRQYNQRVNAIDRGSFTPLVFSTSGLCGNEARIFLRTLTGMLVEKHHDLHFPAVMGRLRVKIAFCLLRWAITCFRGNRSSYHRHRLRDNFSNECRLVGR